MKAGLRKIAAVGACTIPLLDCPAADDGWRVTDELNRQGLALLSACSAANRKDPVLISPFSVDSAFALLWLGSSERVRTEITGALGFPSDVREIAAVNKVLSVSEEPCILMSNSMWVDRRFPLSPRYQDLVNALFPSSVFDFDNTRQKDSASAINRHVAAKTRDMITELILPDDIKPYRDAGDRGTGLVLVNSLYFKGQWADPFAVRCTQKGHAFDSLDGEATEVEMMRDTRDVLYGEGDDYQVVSLPYRGLGRDCSFVAVLPTPDLEAEDLLRRLSEADAFSAMLRACTKRKVHVSLPKLDFRYRASLVDMLKRRGMRVPFVSDTSSFAAITEGRNGVYVDRVSDVIHATRITMTETSTEAAAATAILACSATSCSPFMRRPPIPEFTADHPYLGFVVDGETGMMLFAGVIRHIGDNPHAGMGKQALEKREARRRADFRKRQRLYESETSRAGSASKVL